jgi:hypothetical protein
VDIEYLHRKEIDEEKWDQVIAGSGAETIYPYSWYLDSVAEHWSALVMDGYRYLMPLVWKRKLGISYLYQPYYVQQLGVFSREHVDPTVIADLISKIPGKFRVANIHFNAQNLVSQSRSIEVTDRTNYILSLDGGYEKIGSSYSTNTQRNLRKGLISASTPDRNLSCRELVDFKRNNDVMSRTEKEYSRLVSLLETIINRNAGVIYSTGRGENLNAAAFFAFSRTRAVYLLSVSDETGKEQRSMFRIVDAFIRDHAGSGLILDFEGSNIPSVARFFSGFGAKPETYQAVMFRRFPFSFIRT